MSGTLLLARHATTVQVGRVLSGRAPVPLSPVGEQEAARLADRLAGVPLAAIHSSPQPRAMQTAQAVAARTGLPIITAAALDEIDFGSWAGRSFDELAPDPAWQRWNGTRGAACPPGGETMAAATVRAIAYLDTLDVAGTVLCVTHSDIIRAIVAHHLGLLLDNLLRFDCDPASLTTFATWPGGARLVRLNEMAA